MRGGFRINSGRKKVSRSDKHIPVSLSVSRQCSQDIKELKSIGYNINELFDRYITSLWFLHFEKSEGFTKSIPPLR